MTPLLRYRPLILALATAGLTACGGNDGASSNTATAAPGTVGVADTAPAPAAGPVTASGTCTMPAAAPAAGAEAAWDIGTGAHAPDQISTDDWLPLTLTLDSLAVSSTSPCFTVTRASDTLTHVSVQGQPAITLSRDAHGLTIRSTTTAPIAFRLTGSGSTPITLYSDADHELELVNASITSPDGPALNLQSAKTAFIDLHGQNTLRDSATWSNRTTPAGAPMDLKATLFAEGPLVIRGSGSLDIQATPQHALATDAHVRIAGGSVTLRANAKDGIRATRAFILDNGSLDIQTPAGKGIKVDGKEETASRPLGFMAVNNGTLSIRSHDKAMSASWEWEEDSSTPTRDDDPDPRITINGGKLTITTTGPVRNDSDDPAGTSAPSPEGIESKSTITINNGEVTCNTQDDCLNARASIDIHGGRILAHSVRNDSLDSNGLINVTGGILVATSPAPHPESAFDADTSQPDTFRITGGTVVGLGYHNHTPTPNGTTQNSITVTNGINHAVPAGLWTLRDATGKAVFSFNIPFAAQYFTLSSPHIATGASYTVVTGGTLGPVGENFHGLAIDPTTHTGGTAGTTFTVSSALTRLGSPFQWPPGGPGAPVPATPPGPAPLLTPVFEGPLIEPY